MTDTLNTYGFKPNPQRNWKLFVVDGFELLVALDSNDDGDGYGIRYSVNLDIEGIAPVSIWIGVNRDDGEDVGDEVAATWDGIFNDMDDAAARKALQTVFDQVGPTLNRMLGREGV